MAANSRPVRGIEDAEGLLTTRFEPTKVAPIKVKSNSSFVSEVVYLGEAPSVERYKREIASGKPNATPPFRAKGITAPLAVEHAYRMEIGNISLDQEYKPTDMVNQMRVITFSTRLSNVATEKMDAIAKSSGNWNWRASQKKCIEYLLDAQRRIDRYLFDNDFFPGKKEKRELIAAREARAALEEGRAVSEERIDQLTFENYLKKNEDPKNKGGYVSFIRPHPEFPGEYLITAVGYVFQWDKKKNGGRPRTKISLDMLHEQYLLSQMDSQQKGESVPEPTKASEGEDGFAIFVYKYMLSKGYKYSPVAYTNGRGFPLKRDDDLEYVTKSPLGTGSIVLVEVSLKGIGAGGYYGTKLIFNNFVHIIKSMKLSHTLVSQPIFLPPDMLELDDWDSIFNPVEIRDTAAHMDDFIEQSEEPGENKTKESPAAREKKSTYEELPPIERELYDIVAMDSTLSPDFVFEIVKTIVKETKENDGNLSEIVAEMKAEQDESKLKRKADHSDKDINAPPEKKRK